MSIPPETIVQEHRSSNGTWPTTENVPTVVVELMCLVDGKRTQQGRLSGSQKKDLVISTLHALVDEALADDGQENELVKTIIDVIGPTLIDTLVKVDTRKLKIKAKRCFGCRT